MVSKAKSFSFSSPFNKQTNCFLDTSLLNDSASLASHLSSAQQLAGLTTTNFNSAAVAAAGGKKPAASRPNWYDSFYSFGKELELTQKMKLKVDDVRRHAAAAADSCVGDRVCECVTETTAAKLHSET